MVPPLSNKISRALVAAGKSGEELAGRFGPTVRHPSIETSGRDGGRDVDPDGSTSVEVDAAVRRGGGGEMRMVGGIVDPNSVEVDVEETFEYAGIVSGENNARRKNDDGDGEEGRSMADSDDAPNPEESPESTAFADEAMAGESASRTPTLVPPTVPLDPREPEEVASNAFDIGGSRNVGLARGANVGGRRTDVVVVVIVGAPRRIADRDDAGNGGRSTATDDDEIAFFRARRLSPFAPCDRDTSRDRIIGRHRVGE